MTLREFSPSQQLIELDPKTFNLIHRDCRIYEAVETQSDGVTPQSYHLVCGKHGVTSLSYVKSPLDKH